MADAYDELRQTLITRIEGMIHDVQREIHANNVEHETVDGLCFRGEQLPRQVARLVTANVLDSSHVRLRKINFLFPTSLKVRNH